MTINPPFLQSRYPELNVSGFPFDDAEVAFSVQVRSIVTSQSRVLDYGAGRGEWFEDDPSPYRKHLQFLRGAVAEVVGCDVDRAVVENRATDRNVVIQPGVQLPFEDGYFDVIVSRYVFEHIDDPENVTKELLRILKPGGWLCALTPNKWGYPAIAAQLIPNRLHAGFIKRVQPGGRAENDVFPTRYKLNTIRALKHFFSRSANLYVQFVSGPPSYFFGNGLLFRFFDILHALQPRTLSPALMIFVRKFANDPSDEL